MRIESIIQNHADTPPTQWSLLVEIDPHTITIIPVSGTKASLFLRANHTKIEGQSFTIYKFIYS